MNDKTLSNRAGLRIPAQRTNAIGDQAAFKAFSAVQASVAGKLSKKHKDEKKHSPHVRTAIAAAGQASTATNRKPVSDRQEEKAVLVSARRINSSAFATGSVLAGGVLGSSFLLKDLETYGDMLNKAETSNKLEKILYPNYLGLLDRLHPLHSTSYDDARLFLTSNEADIVLPRVVSPHFRNDPHGIERTVKLGLNILDSNREFRGTQNPDVYARIYARVSAYFLAYQGIVPAFTIERADKLVRINRTTNLLGVTSSVDEYEKEYFKKRGWDIFSSNPHFVDNLYSPPYLWINKEITLADGHKFTRSEGWTIRGTQAPHTFDVMAKQVKGDSERNLPRTSDTSVFRCPLKGYEGGFRGETYGPKVLVRERDVLGSSEYNRRLFAHLFEEGVQGSTLRSTPLFKTDLTLPEMHRVLHEEPYFIVSRVNSPPILKKADALHILRILQFGRLNAETRGFPLSFDDYLRRIAPHSHITSSSGSGSSFGGAPHGPQSLKPAAIAFEEASDIAKARRRSFAKGGMHTFGVLGTVLCAGLAARSLYQARNRDIARGDKRTLLGLPFGSEVRWALGAESAGYVPWAGIALQPVIENVHERMGRSA